MRGTPRYMAPEVAFRAFGFPADVYSYGICLYELLHAVRFLAEFKRPPDLLLTVLNGGRPPSALAMPLRATLGASDGRFADTAAALIAECWDQDWEARPTMVDVTMRLLLRRGKELAEAEWSALSAYTAASASSNDTAACTPDSSCEAPPREAAACGGATIEMQPPLDFSCKNHG